MDLIESMDVFVTVADLKGFAPGARRLGLSPPAVTRMIAGLEERIGARLLQRTTRSVTLTDAGVRFLERARRILADVAEAKSAANAERGAPVGRLVVAAPHVFGRLHVAALVCTFLRKFPDVTGELILNDRVVSLVEEGIDVAIRVGSLEDSSLVARSVGLVRRVVVASPQYLKRQGMPRRPEDVAGHDLIRVTTLSPTNDWRFLQDGVETRIPIAPRYVTNSADAAVGHAELGGGLAMVLSYQVTDAVKAGRLRIVLADFELPPLPIHVVYPTTRLLSAKVRAFADLLVASTDWRFVDG